MSLSNTPLRYGGVTKTFHWLTALLILTLIPLGIIANDLPYDTSAQLARKAWLFSLHKTLGVTLLVVAVLRILWAVTQTKPGLLNADNRPEALLAETVHWLLYGSLIIVPITGWIHHAAATGYAPIWWPLGQGLPFVPKDPGVSKFFSTLHGIFEKVLVGAVILHIVGALKHHVIDRDATLRRMLPGTPVLPDLPAQHHSNAPMGLAGLIWVAALAFGAGLGLFSHDTAAQAPALASVQSDWTVQSGTIGIEVVQMGSAVSGSFEDWTAAISYDDTAPLDARGTATVTIAIPSLALGSVTDQAMGPDFFDATAFSTAVFAADLSATAATGPAHTATGTLTIKDNAVPIALPFDLVIDGDTATVTGALTLDRRDFHIGDSMSDAGSLGHSVGVTIALTATRSAP